MRKGTHLGELEQLVMLSVARLGEEAYAARIRRDLAEATDRSIQAATVHVTLVRLDRKGLLTSELRGPQPVRGGRSTRCFQLTPAGAKALTETREVLGKMWERVQDHPDLEVQ